MQLARNDWSCHRLRVAALRRLFLLSTLVLGCGPKLELDGSEEMSTGHATPTSADVTDESSTSSPMTASTVGVDTQDDDDDAPGGGSFVHIPDMGWSCAAAPPGVEAMSICDVWTQDCQADMKCMPVTCGDPNTWATAKCTPVSPSPAPVGAPCKVEESGTSGVDDCEIGAMCWNVDPLTLEGQCVSFCQGTEANPSCPAGHTCSIHNAGLLILCLPTCDPLVGDCEPGLACQPSSSWGGSSNSFVCRPTQASGQINDACYEQGGCPVGTACVTPPLVESCGSGCCLPFCDVNDPDADATCSDEHDAGPCMSWFMDEGPPQYASVGVCAPRG
jgi:hypothetical protein